MESYDLGVIVNMIDMDVLSAQPPRHIRQVAPQGDQVSVHFEDAVFYLGPGPVDRDLILEPPVFQQLLSLKNHRDTGRGKNKSAAQRGALLGKPAVNVSRPDLLG